MIKEDILKKINDIIHAQCHESRFDCIELKIHREGRLVKINLITDKATGGILISECSQLNKALVYKLDEWGELGEDYTLDVSSPGLDRPLTTEKDFFRVKGREVRFHFAEAQEGKLEATGLVKDVGDGVVTIETKNGLIKFQADIVNKAFQIIEKN